MKNKEEILKELFSLQRFGIKPGLERTINLLKYAGNPHKNLRTIHIAGTNGKGSVSSMIASILIESGFRVGLYTSPHIVKFNERISINGIAISDDNLIELAEKYLDVSSELKSTFFEITTVLAFDYFAQSNVDYAVIETGMGGRFDSTNVLLPMISVITNIDLEHQEYLGDSLDKIAFEKSGIIKKNTPVVVSDENEPIKNVFNTVAIQNNSDIYFADDYCKITNINFRKNFSMTLDLKTINNNYENLEIDLSGKHQINNLKSVITTIETLKEKINIDNQAVYNGLSVIRNNTKMIGRIQLINSNPAMVLDTAHNPASIKALIDTLNLSGYNNKWNIVFSALSDKDIEQVLKQLYPICNKLFLTKLKTERAIDLEDLITVAKKIGFTEISSFDDSIIASEKCIETNEASIFVGSFYLAGEILSYLEKMFKFNS